MLLRLLQFVVIFIYFTSDNVGIFFYVSKNKCVVSVRRKTNISVDDVVVGCGEAFDVF